MGIPKVVEDQANKAEELHNKLLNPDEGTPEKSDTPDKWKHKYEVLQGKFNAQAKDLTAQVPQIQQLTDQLSQEREKTADLQVQLGVLKAEVEEVKVQRSQVNEKDSETMRDFLDDEVADVLDRREASSQAVIDKQTTTIEALQTQLEDLKTRQDGFTKDKDEDDRTVFFKQLNKAVKGISTMNLDPEFGEWVIQRHPGTVFTRQDLLEQARDSFNAQAAIDIYKEWESRKGAKSTSLESQITPEGSGGGDAPSGKRKYTRAEVTAFYKDLAKGKYSKEDGISIDKDITAAQGEGRIV